MEVSRVQLTAMPYDVTTKTNGGGNWLTFGNFMRFFLKFLKCRGILTKVTISEFFFLPIHS